VSRTNNIERKRGNRLGFWFFHALMKTFGLRAAYSLLYFVALHYLIFDQAIVKASVAYVKHRFPEHSCLRRLLDVYSLFVSQGKNLVDRYALAAGFDGIALEFVGRDKIQDLLAEQGKGFILLTAHVGNWQAAMTVLRRFGRTVSLMMRPEDNIAVKQALNIDAEGDKVNVIFTDDSLGGVVEAMRTIKQGGLVSIMGDRTYGYSATEASFLGDSVRFPYGAFSIAAAMQCPVVVLLSAKVGARKYVVDVSHIISPPAGARGKKDEEMKAAVQEFARVLEGYVERYPYQWFVFRDIWKSNA
jgi:predicted LPLAT superfamily acyltransferase